MSAEGLARAKDLLTGAGYLVLDPCDCRWDAGAWFPCARHRALTQAQLDALFAGAL